MPPLLWTISGLFMVSRPIEKVRGEVPDWLDANGMAAYAVFGATKAPSFGFPQVAVMMGIFTPCLGGIIRDMFASEPSSIILRL